MSDYIEHEIVELEFDNRDFEKNVDTSLKTLDRLKTSLQFENSSKGFESIQNGIKSIDFSSLENQISGVENQFTSFIGRLELSIKDFLGSQVISEFVEVFDRTFGQIKSGGYQRALNIEQAQFKIKGLKQDWDTVYKDMDYAVSGTAYGIDQAANAAAQFLASNVKAGEELKTSLRAISGIAAMTSQSYDRVAYIFTAAAGKGVAQAMELMRISRLGINAYAALADYYGVTEQQIRQMSRLGEISFKDFSKAMDDAFGEHAKKANETFTGSLANVRAALSRIGEIYYEPWLRGMIPWNNELRKAIDNVKNALKTDLGGEEGNTFANTLKNLMMAISDLKVSLIKVFAPTVDEVVEKLEFWNDVLNRIRETITLVTQQVNKYIKIRDRYNKQNESSSATTAADKELASMSSDAEQTAATMQGISTTIAGAGIVLNKEIGLTIGSIIDRYKALYEAQKSVLESTTNLFSKWSHNYQTSFKTLYKNLKSNKKGLETLAKDMATLESKGFLSNEFIQNLKNMGTSGADIVHALAKANDKDLKEYMKTWDTTQGMFDNVASDWTKGAKEEAEKSLNEITGIPDAKMEDYVKTYEDMFNQMGVSAGNGFTSGFATTYDSFEDLFNKEIEALEAMKAAIEATNNSVDEEPKTKPYAEALEITSELISKLQNWKFIPSLLENLRTSFEIIGYIIQEIFESVAIVFENVGAAFVDTWKSFNVLSDGTVIESPIQKLLTLILNLVYAFDLGGERAQLLYSVFRGLFSILELGKWVISNIIDLISPLLFRLASAEPVILRVAAAVGDFIYAFVSSIIKGTSMDGALDGIIDSVSGFFTSLFDIIFGEGSIIFELGNNIFSFVKELSQNLIDTILDIFNVPRDETEGGFGGFLKKLFTEGGVIDSALNIITQLFHKIGEGFDGLWGIISTTFYIIPDVLTTVWSLISDNLDTISTLFTTVLRVVTLIFEKIEKVLTDEGGDGANNSKLGEVLESFADLLITLFTTLKEVIIASKEPLITLFNVLQNIFSISEELFSSIANWISEDVNRAYGAAAFFALLKTIQTVGGKANILVQILGKIAPGIKELGKNISGFFSTLNEGLGKFTGKKDVFDAIRSVAVSLLILAAAVFVLSEAFTTDEGKFNANGIAGIIFAVAFFEMLFRFIKLAIVLKPQIVNFEMIGRLLVKVATAFILVSIGFAIITKVIDSVQPDSVIMGFVVMLAIFTVFYAIINALNSLASKNNTVTPLLVKQLQAYSILIFSLGISISMLVGAISGLIIILALVNKFMPGNIEAIFGTAIGIVFLVMLMISLTLALVSKQQTFSAGGLIGLAIFLAVYAFAIGLIIAELTGLMFVLNASKTPKTMIAALGVVAAIMFGIVLSMKAVAKATAFGGSQMLKGLIGLSILMQTLTACIAEMAAMVVLFHQVGITETDVANMTKLIWTMAAVLGIFAGGTVVIGTLLPSTTGANILFIAKAIYTLCKAFTALSIAVAVIVFVFKELAKDWPEIRAIMPTMLDDMEALLPKMIKLLGKGIRTLCKEIINSAPLIAVSIFTVMAALIVVSMQKVPAFVASLLIVLDEILTLFLYGSKSMLPKVLALLFVFLEGIRANAKLLGYELTSILLGVIKGALTAIWEFLVDAFDPVSELLSDWLVWLDQAVTESIGYIKDNLLEAINKIVVLSTNLKFAYIGGPAGWTQIPGLIKEFKDEWEVSVSARPNYKSFEATRKEIHGEMDRIEEEVMGSEENPYKPNYDIDVDKTVEGLGGVKSMKETLAEKGINTIEDATGITTDAAQSMVADAGKLLGFDLGEGITEGAGEGEESAVFKSVTSGINATKDISFGAGSDIGNLLKNGMTSILGTDGLTMPFNMNFDSSSMNTSGIEEMLTQYTKDYNNIDLNAEGMDFDGITGTDGYNPEDYQFASQPALDYTAINAFNSTTQANNETMAAVNNALNDLKKAVDGMIIVSKDTQIKITAMMDSKEVGTAVYPVTSTIAAEDKRLADTYIATANR